MTNRRRGILVSSVLVSVSKVAQHRARLIHGWEVQLLTGKLGIWFNSAFHPSG